jgi:EpsI family protein
MGLHSTDATVTQVYGKYRRMAAVSLRHSFIGLAMLAAAGSAIILRPTQDVSAPTDSIRLETMIPKTFGNWRADESVAPLLVSPELRASLDRIYDQTLARTYVNSEGESVMLSIAYGGNQSDSLQVHLPEGCYRGQGFAVGEKTKGVLNTSFGAIPVARLAASKGPRNEPITYWIVIGNRPAVEGWGMKKAKLMYTLKGQVPDGILIRISSITPDVNQGYNVQRDFAEALLSALSPNHRERLIGSIEN